MNRDVLGELAEIRRELREMRWYIEDSGLRSEVSSWIEESHEKDDADTAQEYVESRLNALLAEYPMYHDPTLSRGEDGFPDACAGCRHYGSACPVLTDNVETGWRDRQLEQAETESEARRIYQQQAIDVGCSRIPSFLEKWDNRHAAFIRRGQQLVDRVQDHIHESPGDGAGLGDGDMGVDALQDAIADGGDPA